MKKILGLDLGTTSIGWAIVEEAESDIEQSCILGMGVRQNSISENEKKTFWGSKGALSKNAERTQKRTARRNLQRYKLRRDTLIQLLKQNKWINEETILSDASNKIMFDTYRLRAKAVTEKVSLEELTRILLMINKKRGYKSTRKVKATDEGTLLDGMDLAKKMSDENLTPGQIIVECLKAKKKVPDFYRSDLQNELLKVWNFQKQTNPLLTDDLYDDLIKVSGNVFPFLRQHWPIIGEKLKSKDFKLKKAELRAEAIHKELDLENIAIVVQYIMEDIQRASKYLGNISDRSKVLYFNKQTVGQYLLDKINNKESIKNNVFYRLDYLNEFEEIWESQTRFHKELTEDLKDQIRDVIIFYQRKLKSQKGSISFCELESTTKTIIVDGKEKAQTIGARCIPRSSPLFQEFKIWHTLNNIRVFGKGKKKKQTKKEETSDIDTRELLLEEKEFLARELYIRSKMNKKEVLKLLFENHAELDLNIEEIEGNLTMATLFEEYKKLAEDSGHTLSLDKLKTDEKLARMKEWMQGMDIDASILYFDAEKELDQQAVYKLWHLLYSYEGDNSNLGYEKLIDKLHSIYRIPKKSATSLANVTFTTEYGNLSAKAIRKILPYLKTGNSYDKALKEVYGKESKVVASKDKLELLPKNSLRNPVVEKVLNQMVNVVNALIQEYGKIDEVRIELARELKKNLKERERLTEAIKNGEKKNKEVFNLLEKQVPHKYISRKDIIKYKLYEELESNDYKTLYSDTLISLKELFTDKFDIDHIIPQARLSDDSFSNKTIELKYINNEKDAYTARDFILRKFGEKALSVYLQKIDSLFGNDKTKRAKLEKLKMKASEIPDGFVERDIKDTQYIAKKAKEMLETIVDSVVSTSGAVTDRLREDWQLVDVMKELNLPKYEQLGLTEIVETKDRKKIKKIKDWTKRNDHRHHAMDALTVAFTKRVYIQYLNSLNAKRERDSDTISNAEKDDSNLASISTKELKVSTAQLYAIERKYLMKDDKRKLRFKSPMPLGLFRQEAKKQMESILISINSKNKVVTKNKNIIKTKDGNKEQTSLTPRGQLHKEKIYAIHKQSVEKMEKINATFDEAKINTVCKPIYRELLLARLAENGGDTKKAFVGANSLAKKPIYIDVEKQKTMPESVKTKTYETEYTIRAMVQPDLSVDKVIDQKVKTILENRLKEYDGDPNKAFVNLDENPIWLNKEKKVDIRKVRIKAYKNAIPIHKQLDKEGKEQVKDYVNTGNNHHIAIYMDENGNLQEDSVSFFDTVQKAISGLPIIDKEYNRGLGWKFQFTMKQNEYFIFPNSETGFDPDEIDLLDPDNYATISPNLFRVQKISSKDYWFRHHLETGVDNNEKCLKDITWKHITSLSSLHGIQKVRINHIGRIVAVGEE